MGEREILNKSYKFSWIWTSFDGWYYTKWKWREKNKSQGASNGKKNKQHQTSNYDISVTSAAADLKFLLCVDLVQISLL